MIVIKYFICYYINFFKFISFYNMNFNIPIMIQTVITKKDRISHNTWIITLDLEKEINYENSYFFTYIYDEKGIKRKPYTPVIFDTKKLVFLIKHYNTKGVADYIISRNIGENIVLSMPIYKTERKSHIKENVLMLAGGTGITPMLQIINYSKSCVKYVVIFSNTTIRDIIINEKLIKTKANVKIYNIISKNNEDLNLNLINYSVESNGVLMFSRVSKELIKQISKENEVNKFDFVYCCGPSEYMNDVCGNKNEDKTQGELSGFLKELGYDKGHVYKF